jgi:hypothetical protein
MHDEWLGGLCQFGDRAGQDGLLSGPSLSVRSGGGTTARANLVDEVAAVVGGHERVAQHRKAHMDWAVRGANG